MTDLLRGQTDFIYFFSGLGFFLLLPICLYLHRRPRSLLPWIWLLLFGASRGLLEWLDLVALSLGTDPVFDVVRLGLLILSFLLLAEFGRAGLMMLRGRGPGRWVLTLLLGLALLGAFAGLPGLRASARYALGLVGALGATAALWLAAHRAAQGRRALQGAALCMAGCAAAAGMVVDPAPFFPASWLNTEVFLAATGVPIQLGRGFLAAGLSAGLSLFAVASLGIEKGPRFQKWGRNLMVGTAVSVMALVITGWFVTQYLGRAAAREVRTGQEHHGQVLQFVLKMAEADQLVAALAGSPGIVSNLASRTPQNRDQAHAVLDRFSAYLPGAIMYVMDREGLTIASSNRLAPDSFLGESYAFRPYFRQALQGAKGSYWALGVTSGELGYYASFPVRDGRDEIIGVAVVKRSIRDLESLFPPKAPTVIIDGHGVVVLGNQPGMSLKSLWPLSAAVREQLIASRQFGPGPFAPILAQAPVDGGDCRFQGRPYLVLRQPLPFQDWSIVILTSPRPIAVARLLGLSVTILLCLVVLSLLTIIGLTIESTSRVKRSETRFRQLYGNLRDGSAVVDMSGNIVEWNPAFQAMLGYPLEELIKLSLRDLTPETWQEQEARIIAEQVLPRGYSNLYEQEYRRRDGSVLPVELQTYLVREDGEQPTGMWVFVRDLTERKRGEEALRESERQKSIRNEILQIFLTRPDEDMYGEVLQVILKSMESRFGVFAYQDEHGALVAPSMTRDIWEQCNIPDKTIRFPPETWGDTIWARAIRQKQSLWKNEPGLVPEGHVPIENVMVVPLLYRDEVFAHFEVANKKGGYSESDKDWLEGIAQFIAPVLHARLERDRKEAKRQQAEAALAAHLQFLQLLLDTIPNPIFFKDAQGAYLGCNKAFEDYLGVTRQEIVGKSVYDLSPRELADEYHRMDLESFQTTGTQVYESLVQAAEGAQRHVVFHKATFPDPNGGMGGLVGIILDITDLKQVEKALALHAIRIQALLDLHLLGQAPQKQILDFVLEASLKVTQSEYCWVGLLDEAESLLTIHAWSQKVMAQCTVGDKPIQFPIVPEMGLWGECLRQRKAVLVNDYQAPHPGKKGLPEGHVPIRRFLAVPVLDGGRIVALAAVANKGKDYTEDDVSAFTSLLNKMWEILSRKRAEAELRESEQRFRLMAETIHDVFWIATPEIGKIVYVSPAYEQVWGRPCQELYQSPQAFLDDIHPEDRERVRSEVLAGHRQGTPWNHEYRIIKPDGPVRWIQDRGFPVRDDQGLVILFTGVATDVTEHKALEAQLLQAQKMEAVGRLAGGVAHDFNNLLMAIMGYGELMRAKILQGDPLYGHLENILKAGDRATALTQQLLTFSRQKIAHPQAVDINRVVLDLEPMLRRVIGEDLDLEVVTDLRLGAVKADPGQVGQIIMNLVVNARDAMPQGGRLTLKTAPVELKKSRHTRFGLAPPGAYVMLVVADTGVGMDEATQAHVFEPFFTTKEPGKGTGLGLSTVYGIVRQSGGYLNLASEPGAGSTFTIYLPRLDAVVPPPKAKIPITASFRGEETVLLVEDEDVLRSLLAKFLRLYGYSVLEARHGGEALLTCERHQGPIHLMVTDVVMPQMSGRELADRLTPLRPEMKVLYMSGYTEDAVVQHGVADLSVAFLQKPFKPIELARQVYAVLHPPVSQ